MDASGFSGRDADASRPAPAAGGVRGRLSYLTYRGVGEALARLPAPVAQGAAQTVASALSALPSGATRLYLRHLERALGRRVGRLEARAWVRRAYRSYGRYWLEGARLGSLPAQTILDGMTVERGWDEFTAAMASGSGVIMALPHIGSWEWGAAWLTLNGYPMTAVAEPLEPPELYDYFVRQREQIGLTIYPLGPGAGSALVRTLRDGKLVGLLCDRDIVGNGVEVEFFGERTTLPGGPATLALRTGAALFPTAVYSGPGRNHTGVILPALDTTRSGSLRKDVARVTQDVAHGLEGLIRRAPEQWHLFQPNWPGDPGWKSANR